jgi:hypothetical protein
MTRVRITGGFLNIGRRNRPGHPDIGLPVEPEHPDQGLPPEEGGEYPDHELPSPPPGIWPPPTIGHPIVPAPPEDDETPGHLPAIPPGAIWPRPPGAVEGLFIVLAHIPEHGWHYIAVDPAGWPKPEGPKPEHPIAGGTPPAQPKR